MTASPAPLAVSMGEPAGIGSECLLKAYQWFVAQRGATAHPFFTIDDPARLARLARQFRTPFRIVSIEAPGDASEAFAAGLPVLPLSGDALSGLLDVKAGVPSASTAKAVTQSIRQAVDAALRKDASGVVTLPIQKSVLQEAGFPHPGHTEFLGELTADHELPHGTERGPVMMLATGSFRAVPVTIHVPLREVAGTLTTANIVRLGIVTAEALHHDFGINEPRLAVTGLNPHAGEGGAMGTEEALIIEPAIHELRARGINAAGPFPGDTLFHTEAREMYDAALAMYHDQALIPIKTVAFHEAVNVTIGLPIIRTSPDHGTALQIAGKGMARPDSTIAAILMAGQMTRTGASSHA